MTLRGPGGLPLSGTQVLRHSQGAIGVWTAKGLLLSRATGKMTIEAARFIETAADRVAASGRQSAFHDWEELDDYDGEARVLLMDVGARLRPVTDHVSVLVRSRLIAAAVNATRIVLRHVRAYTSRPSFEAELHKALEQRDRPPPR